MRFQLYTLRRPATLLATLAFAFASGSLAIAQTRIQQASTDSLIYDLKNPDAPRRLAAARDLGIAKFQPAIPALLPLAEDPDASVRRQVELALEAMENIGVLPGLEPFKPW
jgi:HEAT repeat protein